MERAFQLLEEGKWVKEVIPAVGYKNKCTFNNAFKKRFKHSARFFKK
jgi:AraC-like DNA-binding protein